MLWVRCRENWALGLDETELSWGRQLPKGNASMYLSRPQTRDGYYETWWLPFKTHIQVIYVYMFKHRPHTHIDIHINRWIYKATKFQNSNSKFKTEKKERILLYNLSFISHDRQNNESYMMATVKTPMCEKYFLSHWKISLLGFMTFWMFGFGWLAGLIYIESKMIDTMEKLTANKSSKIKIFLI